MKNTTITVRYGKEVIILRSTDDVIKLAMAQMMANKKMKEISRRNAECKNLSWVCDCGHEWESTVADMCKKAEMAHNAKNSKGKTLFWGCGLGHEMVSAIG